MLEESGAGVTTRSLFGVPCGCSTILTILDDDRDDEQAIRGRMREELLILLR
jgi:hypothetical protein